MVQVGALNALIFQVVEPAPSGQYQSDQSDAQSRVQLALPVDPVDQSIQSPLNGVRFFEFLFGDDWLCTHGFVLILI